MAQLFLDGTTDRDIEKARYCSVASSSLDVSMVLFILSLVPQELLWKTAVVRYLHQLSNCATNNYYC